MKSLFIFLCALTLSGGAMAASHTAAPDESGAAGKAKTSKQSGNADAKSKAPHPNKNDKTTMDKARPATPDAGSAAGETGGPAATGGHTGSTTNKSNSPGPDK
ncbi:hypothetical protein ACFQUU_15345 [Herbaspirillum sp. GCM10030257]|uniref:hypothetical protein n=1 Tax=Herbaspirillum sp. GCM10030257 TaxID=3273393 RepID=UPI003607C84D